MKVQLLKTKTCVYCEDARKFFRVYDIPWEEVDIAEHPEWIKKIKEAFGKIGVPVLVVNGEIKHMGFSYPHYKQILQL